MSQEINSTAFNFGNLLENAEEVTLQEYLETYKSRITQESENLFVRDFLYPLLGKEKIKYGKRAEKELNELLNSKIIF